MEWIYRFLVGGVVIALFASIGDVLRPKGFAGLFGAAPSVALATLPLTLITEGKGYAALEARSMAVGAAALLLYLLVCLYLMAKRHLRAPAATLGALAVWVFCAFALWSLVLR
jgi:hypothetical protein